MTNKIKVYWRTDSTKFGEVKEFEDDSSSFYRGSDTIKANIEMKVTDGTSKELFSEEDGDGDESGNFSRGIILITTLDDVVLYDRNDLRGLHYDKELLYIQECKEKIDQYLSEGN